MNTRMIRNGKGAEIGDVFRPRIKQLDASQWKPEEESTFSQ